MIFPWDLYAETRGYFFTDEGNYFTGRIPVVGAKKDCIEVKLKNDILSVYFKGNEFTDEFKKEWRVPQGVSAKDVTANYESGILNLKVMKPQGYENTIKVE